MNFHMKIIAAVGALIAVALGVLFLWPDPEAAELGDVVRRIYAAIRSGDADRCMSFVHEGFNSNGETFETLRDRAASYLRNENVRNAEFGDPDVEVFGVDGRARFTAAVQFDLQGNGFRRNYDVVLEFHKFDGAWKIVGYEVEGDRF